MQGADAAWLCAAGVRRNGRNGYSEPGGRNNELDSRATLAVKRKRESDKKKPSWPFMGTNRARSTKRACPVSYNFNSCLRTLYVG